MRNLINLKKIIWTGLVAVMIFILAACAPATAPVPAAPSTATSAPAAATMVPQPTQTALPSATPAATQLPTISVPVTGSSDQMGTGSGSDNSGNDTGYGSKSKGKGGGSGDDTGYGSSMQASTPAAAKAAVVNMATDPSLGKILVDSQGITLYRYAKDAPGVSNCSGSCLKIWPPLLSKGAPVAGPGVDASKLATATLADGSVIVTYNGSPLYYYAEDSQSGDVTGQKVDDEWFVVAP